MMQAAWDRTMEAAMMQLAMFMGAAAIAAVLLLSLAWLVAAGIMRHPR